MRAIAAALAALVAAPAPAEAAEGSAASHGAELAAAMERDKTRLVAAYSNCVSRLDHPARGVVVPVESHPDGSVKVDAVVGEAQFFEKEGLVWCGDVTVREYGLKGEVRLELSAKSGVVDRATRSGWLEGCVSGSYGATTLAGRGVYFSFEEEYVKIFADVEITSTDIKFEGVKL